MPGSVFRLRDVDHPHWLSLDDLVQDQDADHPVVHVEAVVPVSDENALPPFVHPVVRHLRFEGMGIARSEPSVGHERATKLDHGVQHGVESDAQVHDAVLAHGVSDDSRGAPFPRRDAELALCFVPGVVRRHLELRVRALPNRGKLPQPEPVHALRGPWGPCDSLSHVDLAILGLHVGRQCRQVVSSAHHPRILVVFRQRREEDPHPALLALHLAVQRREVPVHRPVHHSQLNTDPHVRHGERTPVEPLLRLHELAAVSKVRRRLRQQPMVGRLSIRRRRTRTRRPRPRKQRLVIRLPHNLLLQPDKRPLALPVQHRHVDLEQAEQAIRHILDFGRHPLRRPRHPLRDAQLLWPARPVQHRLGDAGNPSDDALQLRLGAERVPIRIEEFDPRRRKELLQRPAAREPDTASEPPATASSSFRRHFAVRRISHIHVAQISVAHLRVLIPLIHRVQRLRELRAAGLVDAARIDPDIPQIVAEGLCAALRDFLVPLFGACRARHDVLEEDLLVLPSVGEDGVGRDGLDEVGELVGGGVEEAHFAASLGGTEESQRNDRVAGDDGLIYVVRG